MVKLGGQECRSWAEEGAAQAQASPGTDHYWQVAPFAHWNLNLTPRGLNERGLVYYYYEATVLRVSKCPLLPKINIMFTPPRRSVRCKPPRLSQFPLSTKRGPINSP